MTGASDNGEHPERRQRGHLREVFQELLEHVRRLSHEARTMSDDDLDEAQRRLEWLADEVWRALTESENA